MPPRIAIPMPHSSDPEYAERAMPQYERAVQIAGGEPVRISLDRSAAEVKALVETCHGVLLPGSKADVDPARFQESKSPHTAAADLRREEVDDLLLDHAYVHRKPILGICYGLQSLNVFREGSLIQHIPDFLPEVLRAQVNHAAGREVSIAHTVAIEPGSELARIVDDVSLVVADDNRTNECDNNREGHGLSRADGDVTHTLKANHGLVVPVNSSHHQSAGTIGKGLRIVARCPDDGIIEALEGTSPDHFVIAVQWHPERSVDDDEPSKSIFWALIAAAR